MSEHMGPRRVTEWLPGDASHNSAEGLAYYLATQREQGVYRYDESGIREALLRSEHLALNPGDAEHQRTVRNAARRAIANRGQVVYSNQRGWEIVSMPNLASYLRMPLRTEYAYTVTAEVESTSTRNPGTIYRTMVVWSDERLTGEQLVQRARDIGADMTARDRYWGRRGDWDDAKIVLNVWARRQ